MGKEISEAIVAIEVTEAANEEAKTDRLKTRENMSKVNSSGEVMNEAEATKEATEEEETFKENKILFFRNRGGRGGFRPERDGDDFEVVGTERPNRGN